MSHTDTQYNFEEIAPLKYAMPRITKMVVFSNFDSPAWILPLPLHEFTYSATKKIREAIQKKL